MDIKRINSEPETYLAVNGWGICEIDDITLVLNGVIKEFQKIIKKDRYTTDCCIILPWDNYPYCFKIEDTKQGIGLTARNSYFCQYVYQFSHEYCHFLINKDNKGDKTGAYWFEEVICELASIYMLRQMQKEWENNPLYKNYQSYSAEYKKYADEIINRPTNLINMPLNEWILSNNELLHQPEYQRVLYTTIAVKIMNFFFNEQYLWNFVTYLNEAYKVKYTTFHNFILSLQNLLPDDLKKSFSKLKNELIVIGP